MLSTPFPKLSTFTLKVSIMGENEAKNMRVNTISAGVLRSLFTISLTSQKGCDITRIEKSKRGNNIALIDMSKRRLSNLLKRKLSPFQKLVSKSLGQNRWAKRQLQELSRLGGELVVMKMTARAVWAAVEELGFERGTLKTEGDSLPDSYFLLTGYLRQRVMLGTRGICRIKERALLPLSLAFSLKLTNSNALKRFRI